MRVYWRTRASNTRFEHALRFADCLVHPFAAGTTAKVSCKVGLSNRLRTGCVRTGLRRFGLRPRRLRSRGFAFQTAALSKDQSLVRQRWSRPGSIGALKRGAFVRPLSALSAFARSAIVRAALGRAAIFFISAGAAVFVCSLLPMLCFPAPCSHALL